MTTIIYPCHRQIRIRDLSIPTIQPHSTLSLPLLQDLRQVSQSRCLLIQIQKCVQRQDPSTMIEVLTELIQTWFLSLNHTLRAVPDKRLVPHLINMWLFVFGKVLPYMQAVFLPLDHEFKGRGSILATPQAAAEFWGVLPNPEHGGALSSSPPTDGRDGITAAGDE